jgi:HSP20 family protein
VDETNTHYLMSFDLPGVKKEDVKIDLQENQLIVSGERKEETQGQGGSRERFYGAFSRSFTLPQNVDASKVEANYENGVLQIALPKTAVTTTGKQIPIKEGKLISQKKEGKSEKAA